MPVNFQQALQQIREMGQQAPKEEQRLKQLQEEARGLFKEYACELDTLEQLVERAVARNASLRCAAPFRECLNQTLPEPDAATPYTLLAADGSQINPDRHAIVDFGAINVGAIRMRPGQAPEELVQSKLLFGSDLFTDSGAPLTDEIVALKRDLAERKVLADLARAEVISTVALTDGPLELFHEPKGMPEFMDELHKYQEVLQDLADMQVSAAGYVDKPRGDLLIRLLELILLEKRGQFNKVGEEHPLRGVYDYHLFLSLLKPGERSAVFAIQSSSESFTGRLALHFFYINVGREGHPHIARVEIPRWVAESANLLDLLHTCLVTQAHILGASPYPYVLHRAHEIAVVSYDERNQLEDMIVAELYRQGISVGERSSKQIAKDSHYAR